MNAIARPTAPKLVPMNGQPVTMLEIVEHKAEGYRAWGNEMGDFLAQQMKRLAQLIVWTSASNPVDFEDRMEVYDRELRDRHFEMGYHEGLEAGRRECRCGTCFKDRD